MRRHILNWTTNLTLLMAVSMALIILFSAFSPKRNVELLSTQLKTREGVYEAGGEPIPVQLLYSAKKDTTVYMDLWIRDGIAFHGTRQSTRLDATEFGALWIDALSAPSQAYSGTYYIAGELYYYQNPFKKVTFDIRSDEFGVVGNKDPYGAVFDPRIFLDYRTR